MVVTDVYGGPRIPDLTGRVTMTTGVLGESSGSKPDSYDDGDDYGVYWVCGPDEDRDDREIVQWTTDVLVGGDPNVDGHGRMWWFLGLLVVWTG